MSPASLHSQVVQVPIELCSNFTDCQSCAANVNPLCGWCTVEQKCSRRSQCQNSSVSGRWIQGSKSQCISITSVAPTKFISEMPTNVMYLIIILINVMQFFSQLDKCNRYLWSPFSTDWRELHVFVEHW